ncbi:MAG: aminotransferase class V-fold PLP-dependent enzyme [Spirochaetota bacterium]
MKNSSKADLSRLRQDFPLLGTRVNGRDLVYLDNAATTQKPRPVIDAVRDVYETFNSNIHRGVHYLSSAASDAYEKSRETVRSFVNAPSVNCIVFTAGTTDSVNLVAYSYGEAFVRPGDEIIVTGMEHHSNIVPWKTMCDSREAVLKVLPVNRDGMLDTAALDGLMTERTKLLAITHVSNVLGTVNPVKKIIRTAHEHGIRVLVDGAQAVQHFPVDMLDLDCDFYVFSGHKMYGPNGTGVLYAKEELLEEMPPYRTGGGMIADVSFDRVTYAELPYKFEAGTPDYPAAVGLGCAVRYLLDAGMDTVRDHDVQLIEYAVNALTDVDQVTVYGSPDLRSGSVSFNIDGVSSYDTGVILDRLGIAVRTGSHCARPLLDSLGIAGTVRASFGLYNTPGEIDILVEGLHKAVSMLA